MKDIRERTDKAINRFKSKDKTEFMFPSTHDIREEYLVYVTHLIYWFNEINFWKNADKKNHLLIVSKPRKYCIEKILEQLGFDEKETNPSVKKDVSFLFTIGSSHNEILKQWEGDTPSFEERLECLKMVSGSGYQVGIIIEPILDSRPSDIIKECEPFVTGDIWIGLMNHVSLMDPEFKEKYKKSNWFRNLENPNFLKMCVDGWLELGNGKLRLKDSIQKILNVDDRGKIMEGKKL